MKAGLLNLSSDSNFFIEEESWTPIFKTLEKTLAIIKSLSFKNLGKQSQTNVNEINIFRK